MQSSMNDPQTAVRPRRLSERKRQANLRIADDAERAKLQKLAPELCEPLDIQTRKSLSKNSLSAVARAR